ncbi:WD40-repeat-containing domain protein, partial [Dimargaris cristalligena]
LRLRRILRENHNRTIHQIAFFLNAPRRRDAPCGLECHKTFDRQGAIERDPDDTSNLLATVGDAQASVYDNEHCGDHLDIMSNFRDSGAITQGGPSAAAVEFYTCCWIHQAEDAWLATAGTDAQIHVLSLAYSRELCRLKGHTGAITDLQSHPHKDHYILSASRDGSVRLWDLRSRQTVLQVPVTTRAISFHPSGNSFFTGTSRGKIEQWAIP